jgi:hypothetical protein
LRVALLTVTLKNPFREKECSSHQLTITVCQWGKSLAETSLHWDGLKRSITLIQKVNIYYQVIDIYIVFMWVMSGLDLFLDSAEHDDGLLPNPVSPLQPVLYPKMGGIGYRNGCPCH